MFQRKQFSAKYHQTSRFNFHHRIIISTLKTLTRSSDNKPHSPFDMITLSIIRVFCAIPKEFCLRSWFFTFLILQIIIQPSQILTIIVLNLTF